MTQYELQIAIALAAGVNVETVRSVLDAFTATVKARVKTGDVVTVRRLGNFYSGKRTARWGRNPRTQEVIRIRAQKVPTLMYRKKFRKKLREPA